MSNVTAPMMILEDQFLELIASRTSRLLQICRYFLDHCAEPGRLTRPLLGELLSQAMQVEEFLDSYGAKNNVRWNPYRSCVATIKLFADVSYELIHIYYRIPVYQLMNIEEDFVDLTSKAIGFNWCTLYSICDSILKKSQELGLSTPLPLQENEYYAERLPSGRLPQNRKVRSADSVEKTVTMLATAFLNLAAECKLIQTSRTVDPNEYYRYIPDPISEKNIRDLQHKYHNLQSLYDTYVSETRTEVFDIDLPVLRGHISVIFHLLKVATQLAHYFERHITHNKNLDDFNNLLVDPDQLLHVLIEYAIHFAERYQTSAQQLCQNMLKRYTEVGQIEVDVPRYRGFHVRPSTLVARIVLHYGSEVRMEMGQESYNAGSPMDIFRINEKINATKRRWLSQEIVRLHLVPGHLADRSMEEILRGIILTMCEQGKMALYEQPLVFPEKLNGVTDSTLLERIIEELARLQALGKIDIETELKVVFIGDKRVLTDLKLLAGNGYGEDNFGNNIPLPPALQYLRN